MKFRIILSIVLVTVVGVAFSSAQAATVLVTTDVGTVSSGGQPVDSQLTIETFDDAIHVTVRNLTVDPLNVAQNISAIQFGIESGVVTGIVGSSAMQRDISKSGTWSDTGPVSTGWGFDFSGQVVTLNALVGDTADRASHTIIGEPNATSGLYENANGSIAGNKGHNPLLTGEVTFVLSVSGVTAQTQVTEATLFYGTVALSDSVEFDVPYTAAVPSPTSVTVGGLLILGLLGRRSAKRRGEVFSTAR